MGRNRRGRAPVASLLIGLMALVQLAWVPGSLCLRGATGHGDHGAAAEVMALSGAMGGESGAHSHAESHPASPDDSHPDGDPHGSHEGCDCAVSCLACGAGSPSVLPGSVVAGVLPSPSPSVVRPVPVDLPAVLQSPHVLPFSNGPPRLG